jgi:hypothetical protein
MKAGSAGFLFAPMRKRHPGFAGQGGWTYLTFDNTKGRPPMGRFFQATSVAALLAAAALPAFGQTTTADETVSNLPQRPDDGVTWDAADATPDTLPLTQNATTDFDHTATTPLDGTGAGAIDPQSVTVSSLTADALWAAADRTRNHTAPGVETALDNLATAVIQFDTSGAARAEALVRVAELHLRILGDSNTAELMALGGQAVGRDSQTASLAYMRGMAQDLRKAGAVNAAKHLENSASLAASDITQTRTGVLDAATLALRYGVTPQPGLSDILAYDPETVTPETMRDLTIDLLERLATTTGDTGYTDTANLLAEGATPDGIRRIQARILELRDSLER